MAILDIDIGNTRLKWRLQSGEASSVARGVVLRLERTDESVVNELLQQLDSFEVERVRVASVAAPQLSTRLDGEFRKRLNLVSEFAVVSSEVSGLVCAYEDVSKLGVDRWLAVLAARGYGYERALVIDCGSAITLDVLEDGSHRGGYIVPGLRLMIASLFRDTSRVKVSQQLVDELTPGRCTVDAVNRGVLLAVLGLVEKLRRDFLNGSGWRVVVTGGDADLLVAELGKVPGFDGIVTCKPDLVMDGLAWSELAVL